MKKQGAFIFLISAAVVLGVLSVSPLGKISLSVLAAQAAPSADMAQVAGATVDVRDLIPAYNPQLDVVQAPANLFGTGTIWHVGPSEQYQTFTSVAPLLHNGDIVEIDAGTYGCNDQSIKWSANYITVVGVGGQPIYDSSQCDLSGDKGIFNPQGTNMIIDNIAFTGAHGPSDNDAGIRLDGGGYVYITNSSFSDSQDGVLLTPGTTSNIVIDHSEFNDNGNCLNVQGCGHNMYISNQTNANSFVLRFSYSHNADTGHEVKSRAQTNYILYNRIADEADGDASYEVDIPNGGLTYIVGNVIQKGPDAQNSNEIAYGEEGLLNPVNELYIVNNTIVNQYPNANDRYAVLMGSATTTTELVNNIIVGLPSASQLADGAGASALRQGGGNVITNSAGFYDEADRNYYLTASSPAVGAGINPGSVHGFSLTPLYEFQFPTSDIARPTSGALDAGAYEYTANQVVPAPPTVSFSAPSPINYDTPATLTWSSQNALYCNATGNWSGSEPTSGTYTSADLTSGQTYSISCTGAGGSTSQSLSVAVNEAPQAASLGTYTWQDIPKSNISSVCVDNLKNANGTFVYQDNFGVGGWCAGGYTTGVYVPDNDTYYLFGVSQGASNYFGNEVYGFNLDTMKPELVTAPDHIDQMREYTPSTPNTPLTINDCSSAMHLASTGAIVKAPAGYQGDVSWDPLIKKIILGPSQGHYANNASGCSNPNGDIGGQVSTDLWTFNPLTSAPLPMDAASSSSPWQQVAPSNNIFGSVSYPTWVFDPASGIAYTAGNRDVVDRGGQLVNFGTTPPATKQVNLNWPFGYTAGQAAVDTTNHWAMTIQPGESSPGTIEMWNLNGLSLSQYSDTSPFGPDTGWTVTGDTDLLAITSPVGLTYNPNLGAFVAWGGGSTVYFLYPNYQTKIVNIIGKVDITGGPTLESNVSLYGAFTYIPSKNEYLAYSGATNDFYLLIPSGSVSSSAPSQTQTSAPTAALSASPSSITSGDSTTLTWSSGNATSCSGSGFTAAASSGSATISPTQTTTYGITCTGAGGSAQQSTTVTVAAAVTYTIQDIQTTGDFSSTNSTCADALLPGQSCSVSVTFMPTAVGARTGVFSFLDPTTGTTQTIALSGTGVAPQTQQVATTTNATTTTTTTTTSTTATTGTNTNVSVPTSGLIGYWPFDSNEISGTTASDQSGQNHNATIVNGPTSVTGILGQALSFNGSNQYVSSGPFSPVLSSVSLSTWIKPNAAGGVVFSETNGATSNTGWHDSQMEVEKNNSIKVCVWADGENCVTPATSITYGQWYHVVMTYDGSAHTLTGYVNGVSGGSMNEAKQNPSTLYYLIGAGDGTNAGNGSYFSGSIDDVRIYSRALSAAEVAALYAQGSGSAPATTSSTPTQTQTPTQTPAPAPTASLSASPTSINSGGSATLTWSSTNAASCTGSGFTASGTSGSVTVTPAQTTTYGITCSGATASASVSVAVPAPPAPPAGSTVISQIHNAPGWLPNHTYTYATGPYTRVNNGPGWTPSSGTWNPGQTLDAYQLTSTGSCTSGSTGPTGTSASIQDGTCTWKYLSPTDYISITGWSFDNQPWHAGSYGYQAIVTSGSPLRAYLQGNTAGCTSTVAPTGTAGTYNSTFDGNATTASDGCTWVYLADVLYSSEKSHIPTMTFASGVSNAATINLASTYEAQLWNDREYVAGQNGEKSPIEIWFHNDTEGDSLNLSWCAGCSGGVVLMPAPGEGFAANLSLSTPLTGVDPTKGVAIADNDTYRWPVEPDALFVEDGVKITGLQLKSAYGAAFGGIVAAHDNGETILNSILDGGNTTPYSDPAAVSLDTGSTVANSLIIARATIGIAFKYPGFVLHDTIVSPSGTGNVGVETGNEWVFPNTTVADTAIFGFAHAGASGNTQTSFSAQSSDNVTDAPVGDSGVAAWIAGAANYPVDIIPGTTYGSSMAAAFVNPGSDWRPKSGGPLVGAGGAFGAFAPGCETNQSCTPAQPVDTPDIIGTARPQAGSYDIGAWQSSGAISINGSAFSNFASAGVALPSLTNAIGSALQTLLHKLEQGVAGALSISNPLANTAAVDVSLTTLDFGPVTVGQSATQTITITMPSALSSNASADETTSSGGGGGGVTTSSGGGGGGGSGLTITTSSSSASPTLPTITRYLYLGVTGQDVVALQNYLIALNDLAAGDNTGYFGMLTQAAVQKLQCVLNVVCSGDPVSTGWGVVGPKTIKAMTGATVAPTAATAATQAISYAASSITRTLAIGISGGDVVTLQNYLMQKGYLPAGDATGYFGTLTQAGVQKLQCDLGVICIGSVSTTGWGSVGPKTRAAMGL